jgi:hypothetical protein
MDKLRKIFLNGYKSFRYDAHMVRDPLATTAESHRGKAIEFGDVTVLLGSNGAGKSNFRCAEDEMLPFRGMAGQT